jgi:hypothetical protein
LAKLAGFSRRLNGGDVSGDAKVAPSSFKDTLATWTLSVAVTRTVKTLLTVLPFVGCMIVTEGGWVSAARAICATVRTPRKTNARQTQTLRGGKIIIVS